MSSLVTVFAGAAHPVGPYVATYVLFPYTVFFSSAAKVVKSSKRVAYFLTIFFAIPDGADF